MFLLIDARGAFNENNRKAILFAVRHECLSGTQFTFNCYHHWDSIVVRDSEDGSCHFMHSKEGMTQGDPLAMITYGIWVLPLIRDLRDSHHCIPQPLYANDTGAGGEFERILGHF